MPTSPFDDGNAVGQRLTIPISLTTLPVAFDLLLFCVATDGKEMWRRTTRDRHRASPLYADAKVYLTARNGIITVVKLGRKFEILAQNDIGEAISASPAVSNGRIYLRTFESL